MADKEQPAGQSYPLTASGNTPASNVTTGNGIGVGVALGVAFGAAYGASTGNMPQALGIGLALGAAIGAIFDFYQHGKSTPKADGS
ncbi:MAG: hypothetical protein SFX18_11095 [Pirellulales bacterium]|nr:hypothetical protein [Pirellulales bacterium]